MALDTVFQQTGQQRDVALETDATANLGKVLATHAPVFRIVAQQVGKFAALLHQVEPREGRPLCA
jgi:hypothetical protein